MPRLRLACQLVVDRRTWSRANRRIPSACSELSRKVYVRHRQRSAHARLLLRPLVLRCVSHDEIVAKRSTSMVVLNIRWHWSMPVVGRLSYGAGKSVERHWFIFIGDERCLSVDSADLARHRLHDDNSKELHKAAGDVSGRYVPVFHIDVGERDVATPHLAGVRQVVARSETVGSWRSPRCVSASASSGRSSAVNRRVRSMGAGSHAREQCRRRWRDRASAGRITWFCPSPSAAVTAKAGDTGVAHQLNAMENMIEAETAREERQSARARCNRVAHILRQTLLAAERLCGHRAVFSRACRDRSADISVC